MVDVSQRSELSLLDHDALARAVGSILDRHEEIQDWTILYTQRELGMRYPGIDPNSGNGPMGPGIGM